MSSNGIGGGRSAAWAAATALAFVLAATSASAAGARLDNYGRVELPAGGRVLLIGDDLVGRPGTLPGAKLAAPKRPIPEAEPYAVRLQAELGPGVEVVSRTRPGARVDEALAGFSALPRADVVVMVFGPGDLWGSAASTPFPEFSDKLRQLIEKAQDAGAAVILVAPLPMADAKLNGGPVASYRDVVRALAHLAGADLVEANATFATVPRFRTDGVHLATPGSRALANLLAAYFVTPRPR